MVSTVDRNNMALPLKERVDYTGEVHDPKPVIVTPITLEELRTTTIKHSTD